MSALFDQIRVLDDAFLADMANLGLLKRAKRELDEAAIRVEFNSDGFLAVFADGTEVGIEGKLDAYRCSCPSRSICKHVLMALMQARQDLLQKDSAASADDAAEHRQEAETESSPADAFQWLLHLDEAQLSKLFGKKTYSEVVFRVAKGATAKLEEGALLSVQLNSSVHQVRFLPRSDMSSSVCSCRAASCAHRLEAAMLYINAKKGGMQFALPEATLHLPAEIPQALEAFLLDILGTGLARLPAGTALKSNQYATLCHGAGLARFERSFKNIAGELELQESRHASFNKQSLLGQLCLLTLQNHALKAATPLQLMEIAGSFRQRYEDLNRLRLIALGTYPIYTRSGFCLVSCLFFSPELAEVLSWSPGRPIDTEQEASRSLHAILQAALPADSLGASHVAKFLNSQATLRGARLSGNRRLSIPQSTVIVVGESARWTDPDLQPLLLADAAAIPALFQSDDDADSSFSSFERILPIAGFGESRFDNIHQRYLLEIRDRSGRTLLAQVPTSPIHQETIRNLEKLSHQQDIPQALTIGIRISRQERRFQITPIAAWWEQGLQHLGIEL